MIKLANYSLAFLWIATGIISTFVSPDIGFELLSKAEINGVLANFFVYGGSLLDILLGAWIVSGRAIKICCWFQIAVIIFYSILLTIIDASFWVHPFGPLIKNIPILVLIGVVYQNQKH
jgi:hypothetical protein